MKCVPCFIHFKDPRPGIPSRGLASWKPIETPCFVTIHKAATKMKKCQWLDKSSSSNQNSFLNQSREFHRDLPQLDPSSKRKICAHMTEVDCGTVEGVPSGLSEKKAKRYTTLTKRVEASLPLHWSSNVPSTFQELFTALKAKRSVSYTSGDGNSAIAGLSLGCQVYGIALNEHHRSYLNLRLDEASIHWCLKVSNSPLYQGDEMKSMVEKHFEELKSKLADAKPDDDVDTEGESSDSSQPDS